MEELPLGHADSLEDYLTDQPAEIEEVATAFISATEALAAFYASNGKSGGLAPESIRFDKTGKASIRSSTSTSPQGATCFGSFGSPQYAPPEIFKETDKGNTSVSSSDIYSLGFMFYEILLGRKLFRQTFSSQRTDLDWLRWHADAKAKAPTLKSVLPTRSAALSELLESMMEKDVERRPLDFAQIATKLRAVEVHSNRTMIGPSASLNHASKDLAARNAGGRGSKIAAIVIALLLLGIVIWQAPTLYQWVASRVSAPAQPPSAQ
jgi:serine/threonine protein kinase